MTDFSNLPLPATLLSSLADAGFTSMTAIQAQSLPLILQGNDVLAQAATGSGKTAAFALGLLAKLQVGNFAPQALVLCPTRELAEQVAEAIRQLARGIGNVKVLTLCGGVPMRIQIGSLQHGAHVLVGTPGRVLDLLQQGELKLAALQTLVLDEADRMLEMGFADQLHAIVAAVPEQRQTLLFSATYPAGIAQLSKRVAPDAQRINAAADDVAVPAKITQRFYQLGDTAKGQAVNSLLLALQPVNCMVFCNTKAEAQAIAADLKAKGHSVLELHGDLEQKDRDQAMVQFINGSARVLVATDVAARGLDIAELDLVISVHMAHDLDTHTHRIGRTGRAGAEGQAVSLVGPQDDYKLRLLEDTLAAPLQLQSLPAALAAAKPLQADFVTIQLSGGKKDKLRPGDIVGALTRDGVLGVTDIGKIKLQPTWSFVAVRVPLLKHALALLNADKIKGKRFRALKL
jgi:ATP-independent RNA helicase DbpA